MREETLTGLVHPETIEGALVWTDSSTTPGRLADKLRFGDPARGWEGDERLALCYVPESDCWEVWRLEADGQYRMFCRKFGVLDERVIDELVARDTRRGFDLHRFLTDHNDKVTLERTTAAHEGFAETLDRYRHEVRKAGLA